jgi:hypothetical protein
MRSIGPTIILKICSRSEPLAPDNGLPSVLTSKNKNKMLPPAPIFWKKVDENQVAKQFIWP